MADVSLAIQPKSDQLNYDDLSGDRELIITITEVRVINSDQPVSIFYEGCGKKAYKPSKGMTRLISDVWGTETDNWIGKSILLYGDSSVKWAGKECGGIRIKAFTNINPSGASLFVTISRGLRRKMKIDYFKLQLNETDQSWVDAVKANPEAIEQLTDLAYKAKILNNMEQ